MSIATTTAPDADLAPAVGDPRQHQHRHRRRVIGLIVVMAILAATCVLSLAVGTHAVGLSTVWRAATQYTDTGDQWIVYELRIPRTVLGTVVGLALGVSGALILMYPIGGLSV